MSKCQICLGIPSCGGYYPYDWELPKLLLTALQMGLSPSGVPNKALRKSFGKGEGWRSIGKLHGSDLVASQNLLNFTY